jgi:hypothetical protein
MPDVLHWLGITKIDNMVSMSDMSVFIPRTHRARLLTIKQEIQRDCPVRDLYSQTLRYSWHALYCFVRCMHSSLFHTDHLIPHDSRVEIDAKIAAGYFSTGKQVTEADLVKTVGRTWEETEH